MLEVTKEFLWDILCKVRHTEFTTKRTKSIDESIHAIFDESNDSVLSDSIVQSLSLNKHSDDEEETRKKVNVGDKQLLEVPLNTDP